MALPQIGHKTLKALLKVMLETREPILAVGKPGVGKTWAYKEFTEEMGFDLIISHPSVDMPQDYKGMAAKAKKLVPVGSQYVVSDGDDELAVLLEDDNQDFEEIDIAKFLPFDQMLQALSATNKTIWLFDDYGQGTPAVQSATMQLFGSRELAGKKLPECVYLAAATNGTEHKANVHGLLEPVKSRFGCIVELVEDYDGWMKDFAPKQKIYTNIQLFLGCKRNAFCVFNTKSGMENNPNPRLWHKLSNQLYAADTLQLSETEREALISGCIGETFGLQYFEFEKMQAQIPSLSDIIDDPENFPINQPIDVRYAILGMLATQAKDHNARDVFAYTSKMSKEYQVSFFNLIQQFNQELLESDPAQRWWAANLDLVV